MNTLRKRCHNWGHTVLSAFVLSWLSVSLQPCLMAMEMTPDIEMTAEPGHSGHVAHASDATSPDSPGSDCEHCPPAFCEAADSCDVGMSSGCQSDIKCSLDNRRAKFVLKNAHFDLPVGVAPAVDVSAFADRNSVPPDIILPAQIPGVQPPPNLLNCVFLI